VKLPPPDDPSWKEFAERHERFMARHPSFAAHAEEQSRIFSRLPGSSADDNDEADDSTDADKSWIYVTKRHRISDTSASYSLQTPFGIISVVTTWVKSSLYPQAKAILLFTWHAKINHPCELLLSLMSPKTLLLLAAPISLGPLSHNLAREISPDILSDPAQPLAFRLILSEAVQSQRAIPSGLAQHRLFSEERSEIVRQYRRISKEQRRPSIAYRSLSQQVQFVPLRETRAAGVTDPFPREQPLPMEWFSGYLVILEFHPNRASNTWSVSRQGPVKEFMLQLWGEQGPLGQAVCVGERRMPLPQVDFAELAFIEIYLPEGNNER
jgi:hypothetical protein